MADTPDIGEVINKLTQDPEALGRIMSMASSIMGNMNSGDADEPVQDKEIPDAPPTKVDDAGAAFSGIDIGMLPNLITALGAAGGKKSHNDSRTALLLALKPYLSAERSEKIDMMLKAMKLADLAGGLLGSNGLFG